MQAFQSGILRNMVLGAVLALPTTALAQEWQIISDNDWVGTVGCQPGEDSACIVVGCVRGERAYWGVDIAPRDILPGGGPLEVFTTFTVGGSVAGIVDMFRENDGRVWAAPIRSRDMPIIERLRQGLTVGLRVDGRGGYVMDYEIGLTGSSAGLQFALAACSVIDDAPQTQAQPPVQNNVPPPTGAFVKPAPILLPQTGAAQAGAPQTTDPVPQFRDGPVIGDTRWRSDNPGMEAMATVLDDCNAAGGPVVRPGLLTETDIDGDGRMDVIVNFGAVSCVEVSSYYCGTGGCSTDIWLAQPEGDFARIFSGTAHDVEVTAPGELTFTVHGSTCGAGGGEVCETRSRVVNGALVPVN